MDFSASRPSLLKLAPLVLYLPISQMLQCALTPALKTGDTATPAAHIGSAEAAAHLPRARDAAYWILQPLMSGLLDAMATVIVLDGEIGWRAVPAVVAAGLAAYVCCAHDRCKVCVLKTGSGKVSASVFFYLMRGVATWGGGRGAGTTGEGRAPPS